MGTAGPPRTPETQVTSTGWGTRPNGQSGVLQSRRGSCAAVNCCSPGAALTLRVVSACRVSHAVRSRDRGRCWWARSPQPINWSHSSDHTRRKAAAEVQVVRAPGFGHWHCDGRCCQRWRGCVSGTRASVTPFPHVGHLPVDRRTSPPNNSEGRFPAQDRMASQLRSSPSGALWYTRQMSFMPTLLTGSSSR